MHRPYGVGPFFRALLWGCLLITLSGCSFLVGTHLDLVPVPGDVAVKGLPQIVSCDAVYVEQTIRNTYERVCGWLCWDSAAGEYVWCCRTHWRHTDVSGEIVLRLVVEDPAGDVVPRLSARVQVLDPLPQVGVVSSACTLSLAGKVIPIRAADVVSEGTRKTVTVRIPGVSVRFSPACRVQRAALPVRILFADGGQQWESVNQSHAVVTVSLAPGAPHRGPNDVVIYRCPDPCPHPCPYPCPHPCPHPHPCPYPCQYPCSPSWPCG